MKKGVRNIVLLLMGCVLLVACSQGGKDKKRYAVEASAQGWSLEECVIDVKDGQLTFESGNLSINSGVERFEIEIYQENQAGEKDHIFGQSYAIVDGVHLNKTFNDIQVKKKVIDSNYDLKGEIKIMNGQQGEEIYPLVISTYLY